MEAPGPKHDTLPELLPLPLLPVWLPPYTLTYRP